MGFDAGDPCVWLKNILSDIERGTPLLRRYGQHLMTDCRLGTLFMESLSRLGVSTVLEVGAGPGLLTKFIVRAVKHLVAVELDVRFSRYGSRLVREEPKVEYLLGDGLKMVKERVVRADAVVSNTPYSITGPFIASIVKSNIPYALITLQKEVGERLIASPGSREYGRVTVLVQSFMKPSIVDYVSPESFHPPPKVWSALVLLERRREWTRGDELFEELLKCLFNQRRRKASKVFRECSTRLAGVTPAAEELKALVGERRVYQLNVDEFNALAEMIRRLF
ncbi:MAG: 16S rRNA (adenine(1518)-N(6)/adenine(1519)-N(6))-dimethyltransferase RsmA [Zestosphaera sp.]